MVAFLGEEGAGRCAGVLLVSSRVVVSSFTTLPLGAERGLRSLIVALHGDLLIAFLFPNRLVPGDMSLSSLSWPN